jgi:hypothetical protein
MQAERELAAAVDTFLGELEDTQGEEFDALVKEYGWELKTTEWFTRNTLPSDLNRPLRASSNPGRDIAFFLFDDLTVVESDPISRITPAIPVADGGWIVARLDEEQPVRPKTFEEAKVEARTDLVEQRAQEAMKKDADEARAKLAEAVEAGTSFEEAAKAAGFEAKSFDELSRTARPEGLINPRSVFEAAAQTTPGTVAETLHEDRRSVVIYVAKRELVREENLQGRIDAVVNQATNRNRYIAFESWLANEREDAGVKPLR